MLDFGEGPSQIATQVIKTFKPYGQSHQAIGNSSALTLLPGQAAMRGGSRMSDHAPCIADIGTTRYQLQRIDPLPGSRLPSTHAKAEQAAMAALLTTGQRMLRMLGQPL